MIRRLGFLLAVAAMLPGAAVTAQAEPVTDECFSRTNDTGNIPTISSASASCDAPTGRFDLSAEWVSPGDGLGPGLGSAQAHADFSRVIDPTGLTSFDVHVSVSLETARAEAETTVGGDLIDGAQSASAIFEMWLPDCPGCATTAAPTYGGIVATRQGTHDRTGEALTYVLRVRRKANNPFTEPVALWMSIRGVASQVYLPGRASVEVSGNITSISIEPPAPSVLACGASAYIYGYGVSDGEATADCDAVARTFATAMRIDSSIGIPRGNAWIEWKEETVWFAGGTSYAVVAFPITISEASFSAPGSSFFFAKATASVDVGFEPPSGSGRSDRITVIDSTQDEAWTGTKTIRFVIAAPEGQVLESGAYKFSVDVYADLNDLGSDGQRPQWPGEPLSLSLAGSIGNPTITPLSAA